MKLSLAESEIGLDTMSVVSFTKNTLFTFNVELRTSSALVMTTNGIGEQSHPYLRNQYFGKDASM